AAAAIVAAGAVAADHAVVTPHRHAHRSLASSSQASSYSREPVVVHELAQPVTAAEPAHRLAHAAILHHAAKPVAAATTAPAVTAPAAPPAGPPTATPVTPPAAPAQPQVTEVNSQTTQLPP